MSSESTKSLNMEQKQVDTKWLNKMNDQQNKMPRAWLHLQSSEFSMEVSGSQTDLLQLVSSPCIP